MRCVLSRFMFYGDLLYVRSVMNPALVLEAPQVLLTVVSVPPSSRLCFKA